MVIRCVFPSTYSNLPFTSVLSTSGSLATSMRVFSCVILARGRTQDVPFPQKTTDTAR